MSKFTRLFLYLVIVGTYHAPAFAQERSFDFTRDIRPMLSDKCFRCHGNDEETREAGLRLDLRDEAIDMGAIVPGSADDSEAYLRMISEDKDTVMPPPRAHKTLSKKEIQKFRDWINQGATYEEHWSYRPLSRPKLVGNSNAPIDKFIDDKLKTKNLTASGQASPETLVRRLFLDLTGLPPTPEDVQEFADSPTATAYQNLVDRLLDDDAFGERMAVFWLDLVRYADTVGYHADNYMEVSAYRDYVINSFNANKPFDQFTIEQIAGDLLPDATIEQKIASGYNRLLQTTEEGGAQPKEYIAIYAADRVRNVSGVWLGQTMGCAQCHDHKYDPITMKDFYAMSAFFADIKERAVGKRVKNLQIFSAEEQKQIDSLKQQLAELENEIKSFKAGSESRAAEQAKWEASFETESATDWTVPELFDVSVTAGEKLEKLADGSWLSTGILLPQSNYRFRIKPTSALSSIRIEALTHESFPRQDGLSRGNGNFVLTEFEVYQGEEKLRIKTAVADHNQSGFPVTDAIDGIQHSGWAVNGRDEKLGRQVAIFTLEKPLEFDASSEQAIEIRMNHESMHRHHNIGRFRLSISSQPGEIAGFNGTTSPPAFVGESLKLAVDQRTAEQQQGIDQWFLLQSPQLAEMNRRQLSIKGELKKATDGAQTMLIAESTKPRMTRMLERGNWMDESGEVVLPAVPEFLPSSFKSDEPLTRLDLANWIIAKDNPLTARTFVNRIWNLLFGRGISNNLDDLGGQGEPPTHSELLDWLAVDFRDGGWDVKRLVKTIVMSDAYQRSSVADQELVSTDPGNQWLARQGRWRIDAEFVRDSALKLSGFLNEEQIGGRSVKPYQPAGYWQHLNFPKRTWQADSGQKLYRKSLYTFWCRSFLHPTMVAFDAPTREECIAKRARSNIPQQALVRLNDPIFVEASRGFAMRMMQFEGNPKNRIARAWKEAVNRNPLPDEIDILVQLLNSQQKRYLDAEAEARELVLVGESAIPDGVDVRELAAWTQVARAMLNAYETISRD